ncbi:MAG: hypothetical protein COT46_06485 [Sulfurimonas sp. CG08_land_8_20_14_0_20_36_33]|nr:sulfite exporter TauE/SafE family protein [Campylobacterota bacterium]PIP09588.1 MAG: hypothetical protein COX50_10380 [Sulfurimonas sp. CG23_combo_of_CG06-09_8_20_14_all_36_33]PIS25317.1 MAG: hypothetical protein COT46_06485 [Sulfurimonas sp. CG08_land_8_20_14_0_20_36_33]PIU33575.1 MAG: hypothetical protein COT05_11610 [Sulfurimonas sp. CG07_land_8_20_14_0_80_36_56]PIV04044.1 MAG: hypothetical protein COS56_06100 [Sulfurimonas sp. CG03_land_8_20_14_0_80_36_25]PIV35570.1 MAG: hypothetical p
MFSCMPFLAPLLVNQTNGVKQSLSLLVPFSLGRMLSYTLLSVAALAGAGFVKAVLKENTIFVWILGGFTLFMGVLMLYRVFNKERRACSTNRPLANGLKNTKFGLFAMGVLLSLTPCAPVLTLVALSANSSSFPHAVGMGISFGLGAVLVPFLFYGFFLSTLIRGLLAEFKSYAENIEIAAATLLMVVGVLVMSGQIKL